MSKYIAFYLPQFHPIPENDEWYGKGFTEWTNVAKAKPLFYGHYEPHIPADFGFYDLRLPEIRKMQADVAKKYGIDAFCYWHYWFGNGKKILDMPIWEVYKDKTIDFPFCLAWANHSWEKKMWDKKSNNQLLLKQEYLGVEDYIDYFNYCLPLFKDKRYFKYKGKLFFVIYNPLESSEIKCFIDTWQNLAKKEGLPEFYFVGKDFDYRNYDEILKLGFDATYEDNIINIHHKLSFFTKVIKYIMRKVFRHPTVFEYKKAINYMVPNKLLSKSIPVVAPNWDHSPRSGRNGIILKNCHPKYFRELLNKTEESLKDNPSDERIVIIKSWNEWGEGNHMEPDLKYGMEYLEELSKVKTKYS